MAEIATAFDQAALVHQSADGGPKPIHGPFGRLAYQALELTDCSLDPVRVPVVPEDLERAVRD